MRSLLVLLVASTVHAAPLFSLEEFRPAVDSQGLVTVNAAQTLPHLGWSLGLVGDYALDTLDLHDHHSEYRVEHLVTMQLQAAVGLFGGPRWKARLHGVSFQLGLTLPVHILAGTADGQHFSSQSLGDIGLNMKMRLLDGARHRPGLALVLAVDFPSDRAAQFLGEGQTTFRPTLVVDEQLGRTRLALNAGAIVRSAKTFNDAITSLSRTEGTALTYALGASFAVVPQRFDLVAEVFGSHDFFAPRGGDPLEVLAAAKVYMATSSYFEIGASASAMPRRIVDGQSNMTGAPTVRGFVGFVFEPRIGDRDHDGIPDDVDLCPDDPETYNDFEDEDGCPDVVPPKPEPPKVEEPEPTPEPEPVVEPEPAPTRARISHGVIEIFEKVYFKTASAEILPRSFPLLDDVARLLVSSPHIRLLEVAGHADERGDDDYNLRLTEARAQSVRRYLVGRGIDEARLTAKGYGELEPAVDPKTLGPCLRHDEYCWEKNRRVEFRIKNPAP